MVTLPRKIYLTATGKHWKVSYLQNSGEVTLVEYPYRRIIIYGKNYSKRTAITLLNKWIKIKSKEFLTALLSKLNKKIKASYKKLRIHSLKLEWGSYSSSGILSLNYALIFLPPALVKHVIIHELCHIEHPDHSPAFWNELAKYDKSWKKNQKALQDAASHVPHWVIY